MKDGKNYERLTRKIIEAISHTNKFTTIEIDGGIACTKAGKSGCKHQIDVYWKYLYCGETKTIIIECKDYSKAISIGKVRDLFGVKYDIGDVEAWIISRKGFQSGAKKFAKHYGIKLKTLEEVSEIIYESNTPLPFLKIVGYIIDGRKLIFSAEKTDLNSAKFSKAISGENELSVSQFNRAIADNYELKIDCQKKQIKLPEKWRIHVDNESIPFKEFEILYKFIRGGAAHATIQQKAVKVEYVDEDICDQHFIENESNSMNRYKNISDA